MGARDWFSKSLEGMGLKTRFCSVKNNPSLSYYFEYVNVARLNGINHALAMFFFIVVHNG